jgi:hypothetical protein
MGKLVIILMIAASSLTLRADILANGDFSDGTAHWKGDATPGDLASAGFMMSPGVVIELNDSKWTKISQDFDTQENELQFSITYQTSPDCAFSEIKSKVNRDISQIIGLRLKKGNPIVLPEEAWMVILVDYAKNLVTSFAIKPVLGASGRQTVTGTIPRLEAHENKTLYLAFPPGQGSVTLTNVSLAPVEQ